MTESLRAELARVGAQTFTARDYRPGPVWHLVLFRFAAGVTGQQQEEVAARFRALARTERDGRPYIQSIDAGPQRSGETGVNSYDYGFVVRFASLGDRNYYVGTPVVTDSAYLDPVHDAFKRDVAPLLDPEGGAQVLDFLGGTAAANQDPEGARTGTVYDAAGGQAGVVRLAAAWHARVMADEVVSHAFHGEVHPDHVERLATYWGEALGGPPTYSETYGDETSVVRRHSGNGPHEEMDRRAVACFDAALTDGGIIDDPLRSVLHDYFVWATRTTMARYHHSADDVPPGLEIPRWSWGGLVPGTDERS